MTAERHLTLVAIALAIHRNEQGEYPKKLAAVQPVMSPELLVDTYHGKPLLYRRGGSGYLLYSLGANGVDEGGDTDDAGTDVWRKAGAVILLPGYLPADEKIPEGADDISLRIPVEYPPWPWERKEEEE